MTNNERTAFALVKFRKKPTSEGMRILYGHNDARCLQAKSKPLNFEWDIDLRDLHLGVEVDTKEYGGVHHKFVWKRRGFGCPKSPERGRGGGYGHTNRTFNLIG